jgi:sulfite reductase (NADPH) flavoprotein alpha-component
MQRRLHSAPGVILAALVVALSISGSILAIAPILDRAGSHIPAAGQVSVAELAAKLVAQYPTTEQIVRKPSGRVVVAFVEEGALRQFTVDPVSGATVAPYEASGFFTRIADFHRAFLLGDSGFGRGLAGFGAFALLFVAFTGLSMLVTRMGGWRLLRAQVRGTRVQRVHVTVSRATFLGLVLAAFSGAYLSASFFGVVPNGMADWPEYPYELDGGPPKPVAELAALQATDLKDLRKLIFPFEGDPYEPFELLTRHGAGFVDQATGDLASWLPHSVSRRAYELVLMVHSGQGLWWLGVFTGIAALGTPFLASSGTVLWWQRRRAKPRIRRNVDLRDADTVILVGSEGNSTWGFAYTLQNALSAAGHFVHIAEMNKLSAAHCGDKRMFILTATYGDGAAPATARRFLDLIRKIKKYPERGVTVLGFGDREFGHFCYFAVEVEAALIEKGWPIFSPLETINRESAQEFARWGDMIGPLIGADLRLVHIAETPRREPFELIYREDFGAEVDAPTSTLRFAAPADAKLNWWQRLTGRGALPYFEAGDLIGIVPPESTMPRYYSIGSASEDGFLEFSVRKHEHGLCSTYLHGLQLGDRIGAFVRPNPEFHLEPGKSPVIMVGAGCGVGPLAGFIRANKARRPMRLYFGARDPNSDFLYRREMKQWLAEGKLSALITAFSRVGDKAYLQHKIRDDAEVLRSMIAMDAQIMVVGGRDMARDVMAAIDEVIAPIGLDVVRLKSEGRYVEDIY